MILVTGGTGFLGAHLLYRLALNEPEIIAIRRKESSTGLVEKIFSYYTGNTAPLLNKIVWVEADILDIVSLEQAFQNVDYVYHAAAMVSFNPKDKKKLFEINVEGTANIVNISLAKKIKKLCHVSSIAALGRAGNDKITDEQSPWNKDAGISNYSLSKLEAEREVWRGIAEGLNAVIVNPSVILGPGNWNAGSSKLFKIVYNGLKVYTKGVNGYIDVNDVAKAMIWLMKSNISGERFVLNAENISYKQLFDWIAASLKVPPPSIKASPFLSEITWRTLKFFSLFSGKTPFITKETARTANSFHRYSSEKFLSISQMKFTPVKKSITFASQCFLKETV